MLVVVRFCVDVERSELCFGLVEMRLNFDEYPLAFFNGIEVNKFLGDGANELGLFQCGTILHLGRKKLF